MTNIPVPQARYELLKDKSRKQITTKKKLCYISTIILLSIASLGVVLLFINLNYFYGFRLPYNYNSIDFPSLWKHRAIQYNSYQFNTTDLTKNIVTIRRDYHKLYLANNNPQNFKLVCYYLPGNIKTLNINTIDPFLCTHIIVGFARVKNNSITFEDRINETIKNTVELKKQNKNLKVLLSVGGAGNDAGFPEMVFNHSNRKVFIKSILSTIKEFKIDGIDLDWEFPNQNPSPDKKQRIHFSQLLREIRAEINRHEEKHQFLLSVAVAAPTIIVDAAYDISFMNENVDFINLMSYDYHFFTKYTPMTGFNAPLFPQNDEQGYFATLNMNYSAFYWLNKGMDKSKIIVGLPTYAHSFELMNPNNNRVGAPARGYGKLGSGGFVDYADICWFLTNYKIKPIFDLETKSPYAYKGTEWISFDDSQSLSYKAEFIKANNFGGAMILSLDTDDHKGSCKINLDGISTFPLTRKVKSILNDDQL